MKLATDLGRPVLVEHSPGPWIYDGPDDNIHVLQGDNPDMRVCFLTSNGPTRANAQVIAAAPELLAAAMKLEEAESFHANCEECDGEGVPELCAECFPLFDDARVMRRLAIDKAICKATGEDDHFDEFVGKFEG